MPLTEKRLSLTQRQSEIYDYLRDRILNGGYGPTVREIGDHFDIKSPNGVMCHLKALEKKGLIRRESNMSRAICLADVSKRRLSLPYIGTAVSGSPIQAAVSSEEEVEFEPMFTGDDRACICVEGNAFSSLGITDGDYIIVKRGGTGAPGSLIVALDDRHNVALCRIGDDGGQPVPAISGAAPATTRQILGTVVGVVRKFPAVASAKTTVAVPVS